jgi:protein tyrosine phosphatase (PTP) superfamily phosphohydrolase (DUF442 family)
VALALALFSVTATAQDATTAYPELPGLQKVDDRLYRSAQPRDGGIKRLHELGFKTIINLRGASERTRAQEAEARALGLNYFTISLPNWGRPKDARVARILEIINAPESGPILIHCRSGVDRTGMMVAIHRMRDEGWTSRDALAEAERNGMRKFQFWMRDYADDYGDRMQKQKAQNVLHVQSSQNTSQSISITKTQFDTRRISPLTSRLLQPDKEIQLPS